MAPAAWTASLWTTVRRLRSLTARLISAMGWSVPISLLAAMIETRMVSSRTAAATAAGSTKPSASTGRTVTSKPSSASASMGWSTGVVLDGGGDQVAAGVAAAAGDAADGEVVGFGAAGGEDDLAGRAFEAGGDGVARVVEQAVGLLGLAVDAGGVAPAVAQDGEHGVEHAWVERGGGGVVEVGAVHGVRITCASRGSRGEPTGAQLGD